MIWWLIGGIILFFILRSFWKTHTHPAHILDRQAINMNWDLCETIKDEQGYRNTCFCRDGIKVMISFSEKNIHLIHPKQNKTFNDFIELERFLTKKDISNSTNETGNNVSKCLNEMMQIKKEINVLAFVEVESAVKELIKDTDKTNYSIDVDGLSPRTLVFLLITNVIQTLLPTGQYHIYRGTLNKQGNALLTLWDKATNELQNLNYYTEKEAQEDKTWIRTKIEAVG
ncbi:MAG: hypothetical protein JW927_14655 [Deltaproteobacteria bacterium]|nr:hypothetical protein [Deltaproteobacteria bacterium]